jgi:hypothetical protein
MGCLCFCPAGSQVASHGGRVDPCQERNVSHDQARDICVVQHPEETPYVIHFDQLKS